MIPSWDGKPMWMFRRFFWVSVGADTWMWTSRWTQEQIYCFEMSYSWKNVNEMLTCWWDILGSAMLPCRNLSKKSCEVPVACWNNVGNSSGTSCQVCNCPLRWNLTSSSRIEAILFVYARRKVLRLPCIVHFDMQTVSKVTFKPSSCITYIYDDSGWAHLGPFLLCQRALRPKGPLWMKNPCKNPRIHTPL